MRARIDVATLVETAAALRRLLAAVEAGELTASPREVARLEGAVQAIEMLAGRDSSDPRT